jgi:hypothetical protein
LFLQTNASRVEIGVLHDDLLGSAHPGSITSGVTASPARPKASAADFERSPGETLTNAQTGVLPELRIASNQ